MKVWLAVGLGFPLLLVACLCGAITAPTYLSIKPWPSGTPNDGPYRPTVDEWSWKWLNYWYANSEDGVSGRQAWIWQQAPAAMFPTLVPYASTFPSWVPYKVIAYFWNCRNNANNVKRPLRKDSLNIPWKP